MAREVKPKKMFRTQETCTFKRGHSSRRLALFAAEDTEDKTGLPMVVYHCPVCGQWHVASEAKAGGNGRRR